MKIFFALSLLTVLLTVSSCESPQKQQKTPQKTDLKTDSESHSSPENSDSIEEVESNFKPFYVYYDKGSRQNHYTPSGFMPNGKCIQFQDSWTEECQSGKTCMKITYDIDCSRDDQKWAGIYWLNPPNNWGAKKGGYNLMDAQRLTFWARGGRGGEQVQEFTIGGISGNYPDSDTAVIGPVILTDEWRQYTVDLRGKDLSYISGGFSWTTSEDANFDVSKCEFYLDNIRFE